jgi:hypothetical protein
LTLFVLLPWGSESRGSPGDLPLNPGEGREDRGDAAGVWKRLSILHATQI